jgi:glycosyltransferase involved in cell wall biosynthesis
VDCEIVVIDNNSTDDTAAVVESFKSRAPVSYLLEKRTGKNAALNKALQECRLKELVVFTDDDVTPERDWLQQIVCVSTRRPDVAVFGGKVEVQWPGNRQPEWAEADWIQAFGYSRHDLGDVETFYKAPACPFGPNFWVRKEVFRAVPGFDEELGPRPFRRLMGGETDFLVRLRSRGFEALYAPLSKVRHRIAPKDCRVSALLRRAYRLGRVQARLHGWRRYEAYRRSKLMWAFLIGADYCYTSLRLIWGAFQPNVRRSCETKAKALIRFGHLNETVSLFWKQLGAPAVTDGSQGHGLT